MKKLLALALAVCLCLSLAACGNGSLQDAVGSAASGQTANKPLPQTTEQTETTQPAQTETQTPPDETQPETPSVPASGTSTTMTVDRETGEMTISRPEQSSTRPMGDPGTWTVFVYVCGADLESSPGYGLASMDIQEMCLATASDHVRFVIQTGGATAWANPSVNASRNQRFVIENGQLQKIYETPRTGMGRTKTLSAFLTWGVANYPAEKMGLVLWDHGGGSISGVCFDETEAWDSLSLRELDAALLTVYETMTDRFEFIGFDACLMGTLETANILTTYARYMIGSEEVEPGYGWNYTVIGDYLAENPNATGLEVGRAVCDSFYEDCAAIGCESSATLSVVDLSKIDKLLVAFNSFAEGMFTASDDATIRGEMVRGIYQADNFGGNNRTEGYTNMVDLGGIVNACRSYVAGADDVLRALSSAVVYNRTGSSHRDACGLAVYYPLEVQGSMELSIFADICVSPFYLSFVDRQGHASVDGVNEQYDDSTWFDDDGQWSSSSDYEVDDDTGWYDYETEDASDDYWQYIDGFEQTGESPLITFAVAPHLDDNGYYTFTLDDDGWLYAAAVTALVYEISYDGEDVIELGETVDITADWVTGTFSDDFDGYWLSLPDGQNLATYIVEYGDDYVLYSSPIYLNGEETNLRLRQTYDGVEIEGAWDGVDENGSAGRTTIQLEVGDEIVPRYYAYSIDGTWEGEYYGWTYKVRPDMEIYYQFMEEGDYLYAFQIDDIYGDYLLTDFVMFNVEDGKVYFYPDF